MARHSLSGGWNHEEMSLLTSLALILAVTWDLSCDFHLGLLHMFPQCVPSFFPTWLFWDPQSF